MHAARRDAAAGGRDISGQRLFQEDEQRHRHGGGHAGDGYGNNTGTVFREKFRVIYKCIGIDG